MTTVTLVSGGLDSTLVACLAQEVGIQQYPLFIDYGQRARDRELAACKRSLSRLAIPEPTIANLQGFGSLIRTGLTDASLPVLDAAFTPGRNLLFLLIAGAYAYQMGADSVSIGLLNEDVSIFPDQTSDFIRQAESTISLSMGRKISVLAPLFDFHKPDVIALARAKGIDGTYSCHLGEEKPCGDCIACNEFKFEEA